MAIWDVLRDLLQGPIGAVGALLYAAIGAFGIKVFDRWGARNQARDAEKIRLAGWMYEKRFEAYGEILSGVQEFSAASRTFFVEYGAGLPDFEEQVDSASLSQFRADSQAALDRLRASSERCSRVETLIDQGQRDASEPMLSAMRGSFGESALSLETDLLIGPPVRPAVRE